MPSSLVSNGLLDAAGAAAFTALLVQQTKFLVEYAVKPTNPQHDNFIRLYAILVAIAVVVIAEGVSGVLTLGNGQAVFTAVVQGFGVGVAAISGYHLLNGSPSQTSSGAAVAAPPAAPVLDQVALQALVDRVVADAIAATLKPIATAAGTLPAPVSSDTVITPEPAPSASDDATNPPATAAAIVHDEPQPISPLAALILQVAAESMPVRASTS